MNSSTAFTNLKNTGNHPPSLYSNAGIVTDTNNLSNIKAKIRIVSNTNKPVIYLNLKLLNNKCMEVLKMAKENNVSVMFVNHKKVDNLQKEKVDLPVKNSIKLRLEDGTRFLKYRDIIRLESVSNYTFIHTTLSTKPVISSKTLKYFQQKLNKVQFVRVHRSHLVNKAFVKTYVGGAEKCLLLTTHKQIEISRRKLKEVLKSINYNY